jgi:hypothetical protein
VKKHSIQSCHFLFFTFSQSSSSIPIHNNASTPLPVPSYNSVTNQVSHFFLLFWTFFKGSVNSNDTIFRFYLVGKIIVRQRSKILWYIVYMTWACIILSRINFISGTVSKLSECRQLATGVRSRQPLQCRWKWWFLSKFSKTFGRMWK